jgi:predicted alpha-1,2-mannosidase
MKRLLLVFISVCLVQFLMSQEKVGPTSYVDPFIGTSNYGATYPGAVVPWGMASVVPFNVSPVVGNEYSNTNSWCSNPYVSKNTVMTGFSHVNLSGVGCPDLGSILLMPITGELVVNHEHYGSTYSNEEARPGYYTMQLDRYGVGVEVSATRRTGISRYTFPAGTSHVLVNLGHGLTNETGGMLNYVSDTELEGYKLLGTFCYHQQAVMPVYFVVRISKSPESKGYWKFQKKLPGARHNWSSTSGKYKFYKNYTKELSGEDIGAYLTFNTKQDEIIEVRVGISYVSIEQARLNLDSEQAQKPFERLANEAHAAWEKELSTIEVEGGTHEDKVKFYTALYHVLLHPNTLQDVDGQYPAMESSEIRTVEGNRYTVFSLWDTYRTVHPFMSLVYPDKQLGMINSMLDMYKESGWLPKWELYGRETHVMEGDPALIVLADTYLRGITDFDTDLAFEAMKKHATTPGNQNFIRKDNDFFLENHYIPFEKVFDNSVSQALEYYVAEYALSQFAKALGKKQDYKEHLERSLGYKKYFDKSYNLLRPVLRDGTFMAGFNPVQGVNFEPVHGFHEGNSWQYSFAVPHDIKGLIQLMGGDKTFVRQLNTCFKDSLFDMSNEPDMGYPYFFNFSKGNEWQTQRQVHDCINRYFHTGTSGLPGNDDTGTLSAWLLYSMMGIYPVCPGHMDYALSSPVFDKVTIHLNPQFYEREKLVIEAQREAKGAVYIKGIQLNGKTYNSFFLNHHELIKKGRLTYQLSTMPDK